MKVYCNFSAESFQNASVILTAVLEHSLINVDNSSPHFLFLKAASMSKQVEVSNQALGIEINPYCHLSELRGQSCGMMLARNSSLTVTCISHLPFGFSRCLSG